MVSRIVYEAWEKKPTGAANAVIGIRNIEEGQVKIDYFSLKQPLHVATRFELASNTDKTSYIVGSFRKIPELADVQLRDRFHDREKYQTFEAEIPFDKEIVKKLPNEFQKGEYTKTLNYQMPWFYREIEMDERLKRALEDKREVDSVLKGVKVQFGKRVFNQFLRGVESGEVPSVLRGKVDKIRSISERANFSLGQLDQENSFRYNPKTEEFEVYLNSQNGINRIGDQITAQDVRNERWVFYDIEKPLWKTDYGKSLIRWRNYLAYFKEGRTRAERRIPSLMNALEKNENPRKEKEIEERIQRMQRAKENFYSKPIEERELQRKRIVEKLEAKLAEQIAGKTVRWWEEKYDANISWFPLMFKMEDGSEIKELHTLYRFGMEEVKGFKVVSHRTEKELLEAVSGRIKEIKPFVYANQNLAYDISQTRLAAQKTKAEGFDFVVKDVLPGRDVCINAYQRVKENGGIVCFDLWRLSAGLESYRSSSNPKGNHKLESNAKFHNVPFKKSINYDQMRELEVLAIDGDINAMKLLADYAVDDVMVVRDIMAKAKYVERVVDVQRMMPYTTLTKVAFSPSSTKEMSNYKHWKLHGNHVDFGWLGMKRQKEREIVTQKRLPQIKRAQLSAVGVREAARKGVYSEVVQVYLPLELGIKDAIISADFHWEDYFNNLSSDPLERIAQLQFVKQYFAKNMGTDYYQRMNAYVRLENILNSADKPRHCLETIRKGFERVVDEEKLKEQANRWELSREKYRANYASLPARVRALVRVPRLKVADDQTEMDIEDWMLRENHDFVKMIWQRDKIDKVLSKKQRVNLANFSTMFNNFINGMDNLARTAASVRDKLVVEAEDFALGDHLPEERPSEYYVKKAGEKFDINNPRNIVYLSFLHRRARKMDAKFFASYGIPADSPKGISLRSLIREYYSGLAREIRERRNLVVQSKDDYLYLYGGNLEFDETSAMIPIRKIRPFVVDPGNPRLMKKRKEDSLEEMLFKDEDIDTPATEVEFIRQ